MDVIPSVGIPFLPPYNLISIAIGVAIAVAAIGGGCWYYFVRLHRHKNNIN
jgi:ABC-type antimicrobial peptide transport system permease subunit